MQIARTFSIVLLAVAAGACSSSSSGTDAPVIDSLDMPTTATVSQVPVQGGGTEPAYLISGTMSYHDDSENVVSFQVHVVSPANFQDQAPVAFPTPFVPKGSVVPQLAIPSGQSGLSAGTTVNYEITIQSASGLSSAPSSQSVTLQ